MVKKLHTKIKKSFYGSVKISKHDLKAIKVHRHSLCIASTLKCEN